MQPTPSSPTDLKGFLGLTRFYRCFICNYAAIARPLTMLLQKDQFHWSEEAQLVFNTLKRAMTMTPVLINPNFNQPFILEIDASGVAMGTIVQQQSHLIAFFGKVFFQGCRRSSCMFVSCTPSLPQCANGSIASWVITSRLLQTIRVLRTLCLKYFRHRSNNNIFRSFWGATIKFNTDPVSATPL